MCIKDKILSFLNKHNIVMEKQFGFQRNLSTNDTILDIADFIYNSMCKKNKCTGVFLFSRSI